MFNHKNLISSYLFFLLINLFIVLTLYAQNIFNNRMDYVVDNDYNIDMQPIKCHVIDINNDNYSDVVLLNGFFSDVVDEKTYSFVAFLNNGKGIFQQLENYQIISNNYIYDMSYCPVNNDEYIDFVIVGDSLYFIFLNEGNGNFSIQKNQLQKDAFAVSSCDIDGDFDFDLAIAHFDDDTTVTVLLNNGFGIFTKAEYYKTNIIPNVEYPNDIITVNLNDDKYPDILVLNWVNNASGSISILLNNEQGKLIEKGKYPIGGGGEPQSFALTDLNKDGFKDVVVANGYPGSISVLFGDSSLAFSNVFNHFNVRGYTDITAFDFNLDGFIDVAAIKDSLQIFINKGDGILVLSEIHSAPYQGHKGEYLTMSGGDIDNDGDFDLITTNLGPDAGYNNGGFSVFLNSTKTTKVLVKQKSVYKEFSLIQNYPNPFNSQTLIFYELKQNIYVKLKIYDQIGKEVITLVNEKKSPGNYQITWNGRNKYGKEVSSGIYFCQLNAGFFYCTKKVLLIH